MAEYKIVDTQKLESELTGLAEVIREKTGEQDRLSIGTMTETLGRLPGLITASASADTVVLEDASGLKLRGLKLFGKTTQDGTPGPEAPVEPVNAGAGGSIGLTVAGKNLFSGWESGRINSSNGGFQSSRQGVRTDYIPVPYGANELFISGLTTDTRTFMAFYDQEKAFISRTNANPVTSLACTTPENTAWVALTCYLTDTTDPIEGLEPENVQIELGPAATAYEPYKPVRTMTLATPNGLPGIPVASGGNYTDGSGQQWVCDEMDLGRGVYVQRVLEVVLDGSSDESWSFGSTTVSGKSRIICRAYTDSILGAGTDAVISDALCSHYPARSAGPNGVYGGNTGMAVDPTNRIVFFDPERDTKDAFLAWLEEHPVTCLFRLAVPMETPLSDDALAAYAALRTNCPNTTVLNDCGAGMEVSYVADTQRYIDRKFAELAEAIVNT